MSWLKLSRRHAGVAYLLGRGESQRDSYAVGCGGLCEAFGESDKRRLGHRRGSQPGPRRSAGGAGHVHDPAAATSIMPGTTA